MRDTMSASPLRLLPERSYVLPLMWSTSSQIVASRRTLFLRFVKEGALVEQRFVNSLDLEARGIGKRRACVRRMPVRGKEPLAKRLLPFRGRRFDRAVRLFGQFSHPRLGPHSGRGDVIHPHVGNSAEL